MNFRRPQPTRRDLLRPLPGRVDPAALAGEPAQRGDLLRASRPAMGTCFEVRVPLSTPDASALAMQALDVVDRLEAQMTIYNDGSEIARINAKAHAGAVTVEPKLFQLLERAVAIGAATGAAYDVTSGALSEAWGFVRGPKRIPDPEILALAREQTGQKHLRLDPERQTVFFDRPGIKINLGSIGKGYAIDRAIDVIRDHWWSCPALVHGGQSSAYALGSPPDQFAGRWEIRFRNPFDAERPLGSIFLRNRGIGTSGGMFQQFEAGGRIYSHLIDPRTGEPPREGPAAVTVLAPTAAEADALSTAFFLLGPAGSRSIFAQRPDVAGFFVLKGPDDGRPIVISCNATDDDFRPDRFVRLKSLAAA